MNNKFVSYLAWAVLCACLLGGPLRRTEAASFTYSEQRKQIKAGVLVLSNESAVFVNPYAFHIMNQRHDLMPSGWDFYNPLAPTHVTQGIVNRWGAPYTQGQAVHKDMGCYWEVFLGTATPDDIAQFDVLLIPGRGDLRFTLAERDKLRKFVDNGGVLWVDNRGGARFNDRFNDLLDDEYYHFFIEELQFGQFANQVAGPVSVPNLAKAHSLLNRPFLLTATDVNKLGVRGPGDPVRILSGVTLPIPDSKYFTSVLVAGGNPVVSVAHYGSGHIVVVAVGVSSAITDPVGVKKDDIGNDIEGFCGDRFMFAEPEDLRFAYNIVSLGSQHATFQKAPRHPGYSFAEIGGRLSTLWEWAPDEPTGPTGSSPAILDDMLFYVDGAGVLHAFEISPWKDRDGDGNPDDGNNDPEGASYDELWFSHVGEGASPPTAAYVPIGGIATPVVFVTLRSGQVVRINALTGQVLEAAIFTIAPAPFDEVDVPAPVYVDGAVYLGDGSGYLHARNYFPPYAELKQPASPVFTGAAHSPTVGYFYDPASGATDLMVYLAKRGDPASLMNGELWCYPMAAFNEVLKPVSVNETGLMKTRSTYKVPILDDPSTRQLYYVYVDPGPPRKQELRLVPDDQVTPNPDAGHKGAFQIVPTYFTDTINGATVIADYQLDYSTDPNITNPRSIGVKHPPPSMPDYTGIACAPAAGKKDLLYVASENGSFYAVKEKGRGDTITCKWRWHLGDPDANDPDAKKVLGLSDPAPIGSPAVVEDMVYFAVNDGPQGMILAFKADPVFYAHLPEPARPGSVKVKQYDSMNTTPGALPIEFGGGASQDDDRPSATYIVDYDSGKITFLNFFSGGEYLSASRDLILEYIQVDGDEALIAPPVRAFYPVPGEKWNNLVWYIKLQHPINGAPLPITSSLVVMGDILYVGCEDGILTSMDVVKIGRGRVGPAERVEWDWATGENPPGERKAWAEPVMGVGEPILASVAGSHGMLAVATAYGVAVLHNPTTLIADGDRLVEMDVGGRVSWSCDSTTELARTSAAQAPGASGEPVFGSVKVPFNRPAVARRAEIGGMIVADTGNNRVVHIDSGGSVLWQITGFEDPGQLLPAGSPLSLNRPRDVSMWVVDELTDPSDPDSPSFPAYHYSIADSGNYRVLDIAARRDPATGLYRNELDWTTKTLADGKKYEYVSARSIYDAATNATALVCVVANAVNDAGVVSPGGALLKITNIGTPNETYTVCPGLPLGAPNPDKIARPVFFSRYYTSSTECTDVALETDAVYVVDYNINLNLGTVTPVTRPVFRAKGPGGYEELTSPGPGLPGLPLAAAYAQILPNGNVLVTNKATVGSAPFKGEIFELKLEFDPVISAWKWVIEAQMGAATPNSHGLRQPSSGERQLYR